MVKCPLLKFDTVPKEMVFDVKKSRNSWDMVYFKSWLPVRNSKLCQLNPIRRQEIMGCVDVEHNFIIYFSKCNLFEILPVKAWWHLKGICVSAWHFLASISSTKVTELMTKSKIECIFFWICKHLSLLPTGNSEYSKLVLEY